MPPEQENIRLTWKNHILFPTIALLNDFSPLIFFQENLLQGFRKLSSLAKELLLSIQIIFLSLKSLLIVYLVVGLIFRGEFFVVRFTEGHVTVFVSIVPVLWAVHGVGWEVWHES